MSGVMGLKKTFLGHQLVDKARPCHFVFNVQLVWFLFFFSFTGSITICQSV